MKLIGKIDTYNGRYGTIVTQDNQVVDFDYKDISFDQNINIGDIVEFRLEVKSFHVKIARNINLLSNEQSKK